jgi:hypothetical protein
MADDDLIFLTMPYHKNSISPQGTFEDVSQVKDHPIAFSMTVAEKQQLCIFWPNA